MNVSYNDLQYFNELARQRNMTLTAKRLGITQPSLSLAIKRIEQELNITLFIRSKKGVELTNAGKEFLIKTDHLIEVWEDSMFSTKKLVQEVRGHIRFGVHSSVGLFTMPYFIPGFLNKYPEVTIDIEHHLSSRINEKVIDLGLDVGIVVNPTKHPDLIIQKLFTDEVCLWKKKGSDCYTLICDKSLIQSTSILKKLKSKKIGIGRTMSCSNLENIVALVNSGAGMGIIPARVVKQSKLKLEKVDDSPVFKDEFCVVYRVEQRGIKLINEFVSTIKKSFD